MATGLSNRVSSTILGVFIVALLTAAAIGIFRKPSRNPDAVAKAEVQEKQIDELKSRNAWLAAKKNQTEKAHEPDPAADPATPVVEPAIVIPTKEEVDQRAARESMEAKRTAILAELVAYKEAFQKTLAKVHGLGDRIVIGCYAFRLCSANMYYAWTWNATPTLQPSLLVVDVEIESNCESAVSYNALNIEVKDVEGREYHEDIVFSEDCRKYGIPMDSIEPNLSAGKLYKGDRARGYMCFKVHQSSGYVLQWQGWASDLGGPLRVATGY